VTKSNHAVVAVLFLVVTLFSVGGCVTNTDGERGRKFFTIENWEEFEDKTSADLRNGRQTMTISDVRKLIPSKPIMTARTADKRVYGWYYARSGNFIWDFGLYGNAKGAEDGRFLTVEFTAGGVLWNFEFQNVMMPSKSSYFTSKPIIDEGMVYLHYTILSNMLGRKMDNSLEKSRNDFMNDLKELIKTDGADFVDKAKDAVGELNTNSLQTGSTGNVSTTPPSIQ